MNSTNNQLRAVLWDMDGTLFDSAEYHWLAWHDTLAGENYTLTRERFEATFGQRNDTILRTFFGEDFPLSEIERISSIKEKRYRALVRTHGIELLPGVHAWLARLKDSGWQQAIASSAPRENIDTLLEALDATQFFDATVSAEDVQRGKPDPQIFQTAATRLRVPPQGCIVVEDSPAGLEGARRAGMRSIGVSNSHSELQADLVVKSLADLPDDAFNQLLRAA